MEDGRNVIDEFKGWSHEAIVNVLDMRGTGLEIAIENTLRDFNMGSIVRSANAFGVRCIHVIGRRQWNKRGAMATDKYLTIEYWRSVAEFHYAMNERNRTIIAVDNIQGSIPLQSVALPKNAVLTFGQEGPGISDELAQIASKVVAVEQFGSTRSLNVGVAAGIVMYAWLRQHTLQKFDDKTLP
jgi:tRNA G18 (ribose-2'-O)-methylase SpoU